jgi:mannan endo-1,4-beta-mannosidase
MQRRSALVTAIFSLLIYAPFSAARAAPPAPVNPHASSEARALLQYFDSISGQYTLTGQHNFPNDASRWTDRAYDLTGKYPALFGQDFGFSGGDDKDSITSRPAMIAEVKRQYEHGAVIALTWHAVRPTDDEPVTFHDSVQGHLSDFEWHELLTPGTDLNKRWCAQVDVIAGYLQQLRDAHVPVLFRGYHEMNGSWFWWGGRPGQDGSAALYRQLYDRFVNVHHLDNLVWVWNVNTPSSNAGSVAEYYPGPQYADILTMDIYGEFKPEYYTEMLTLAAGKPIALGEVGAAPTPEILAAQPGWTYFMVWSNLVDVSNTTAALNAIYHAPHLLTRDDLQIAKPMAEIRNATDEHHSSDTGDEPVTPDATAEARALLTSLYHSAGKQTLSGQQNTPQAVSAASDGVLKLTGKRPAIYGEELDITSEMGLPVSAARQAIVDEAKREHQDHAVVSLSWHPARPTDETPASEAKSVRGQLTDFEWTELLTPGTRLYSRWCAQVDDVAATLKQLQLASVPVLWQPYPEANGKTFWWAGRKGNNGSAALYRQLFDRLVNHDGVHNLVWVWDAATPGLGPAGAGALDDFFPGLLYVDALAINNNGSGSRFRSDTFLSRIGVGKVIGLGLTDKVPAPDFFTVQPGWAWFLASPTNPRDDDALRKLYGDSRISSLPVRSAN